MPTFKVTLSRRMTPNRHGMPAPNPFLASLPRPGAGATHVIREWVFDAEDETEVKQLLREATKAGIENVRGFTLQSIERVTANDGEVKP